MRIHCSKDITDSEIYKAARFARVDIVTEGKLERGSRSHDHAFEIKLEGESRRRPNGGSSGKGYASGYAATWDQWGVFLSVLFDLDPRMSCWAYTDRDEFHRQTEDRFRTVRAVEVGHSTNYNVVNTFARERVIVREGSPEVELEIIPGTPVTRLAEHYWPDDAHGDHRFEFAGVPRSQSCTKCTATRTW